MTTTDGWSIDVFHASHDEVKMGNVGAFHRRVSISNIEFPDPLEAEQVAALMVMAIHGGMATKILLRL